ncbi:MAG: peptide ABC transporter substrate-binding protein [Clostridiales bacterium]|nr:peptide ABC transporter substrate-binding protein [Clostridiales bacterium]
MAISMFKTKRTAVLLAAILIITTMLSGCSSTEEKVDFIYPFSGEINSFDPQVASTSDEFLIIENCFEGLIRVNDDDSIQAGVAESWEISDDGKTYTFYLRKGAKWNITEDGSVEELMGEDFNPDITANDFVFALQRAVDPNTDCPLYSSVSGIKNAKQIHSGKKDVSSLGVKAVDDYTLTITLNSADDTFMSTLSTSVAMPCNEEFFNATKGRYGLGLEYSMFNGQFYVSSILEASYILKNNSNYVGEYPSQVTDITLEIIDDDTDIAKNLKSGYYDCAYISGQEYEQLDDEDISTLPYSDKMWAIILNKDNGLFSEELLRQAVALSISDINTDESDYLSNATGFAPPSCTIGTVSATEAIGNIIPSQDGEKAQELWREGLENLGATSADLTVIVPEDMEDIAKSLVQGIQGSIGKITTYGDDSKISFSLKIDVLSESDFETAFSNGDYDLALYEFTAQTDNTVTFLEQLVNGNYFGTVSSIEDALQTAKSASASSQAEACRECEEAMMEDYSVIPVLYESSYYAQAKGVQGVQFHPGSGRVCFVNATRED